MWNLLLHATLLAPRILRWLLVLWKKCEPVPCRNTFHCVILFPFDWQEHAEGVDVAEE